MTSKSKLSEKSLEKAIRGIIGEDGFDLEAESQKSIRRKLAERLGLDEFPASKKGLVKDLVVRIVNEEEEDEEEDVGSNGDEEDDDADDDDDAVLEDSEEESEEEKPRPKRKSKAKPAKKTKKAAPKKRAKSSPKASSATSSYGPNVKCLLELGSAMRLGPRLYKGTAAPLLDVACLICSNASQKFCFVLFPVSISYSLTLKV